MRRMSLITVLAMAWLATPLFAQSSVARSRGSLDLNRRSGRVSSSPKMHPIRALLLKRVDRVSWEETQFSDVLDWLKTQSTEHGKVNVVVRWAALGVESITPDSEVTLEMEGATVKDILDEVLDGLSDLDPLTYVGKNNILKISTKSDFDRKLFVRTYDIADILFTVRNYRGSPQIDLQNQQQSGGGGGGSQGQARVQSVFGGQGGGGNDDDDDDEDEDDDERAEEIMEWIQTIVEPESWVEAGGLGAMRVMNKQLTVYNTLTVHEILGGPFHLDE